MGLGVVMSLEGATCTFLALLRIINLHRITSIKTADVGQVLSMISSGHAGRHWSLRPFISELRSASHGLGQDHILECWAQSMLFPDLVGRELVV